MYFLPVTLPIRLFGIIVLMGGCWLVAAIQQGRAQDIAGFDKEHPLKLTGSVAANGQLYHVGGIPPRFDPYNWTISGNINANVYGVVNLPFSFLFGQMMRSFRQPFNTFGVSPSYKWVRAHLGYRTMEFSSMTLSGNLFLGVGIELYPKNKLRFATMYGRLMRQVAEDTVSRDNVIAAYRRMGYGMKVGYGDNMNFVDLIVFRAKDDPNSIPYTPVKQSVRPAENLVFAINARKQLYNRLNFGMEYAVSALNRDITAPTQEMVAYPLYNYLSPVFTPRVSSSIQKAFKGDIVYNANSYSLNANFQHVDPNYISLGTFFFINDVRSYTVGGTGRLFQSKVTVGANVGQQWNNLDKQKTDEIKRTIFSSNITYTPTPHLLLNASYSNFVANTNLTSRRFEVLDTLRFSQITNSAMFLSTYTLPGQVKTHSIMFNAGYQRANDNRAGGNNPLVPTNNQSLFYNASLGYTLMYVKKDMALNFALSMFRNELINFTSNNFGPVAGVTKSFQNRKIRTSAATSFMLSTSPNGNRGHIFNVNANGTYFITRHHAFNLGVNFINQTNTAAGTLSFYEIRTNAGYAYTF